MELRLCIFNFMAVVLIPIINLEVNFISKILKIKKGMTSIVNRRGNKRLILFPIV